MAAGAPSPTTCPQPRPAILSPSQPHQRPAARDAPPRSRCRLSSPSTCSRPASSLESLWPPLHPQAGKIYSRQCWCTPTRPCLVARAQPSPGCSILPATGQHNLPHRPAPQARTRPPLPASGTHHHDLAKATSVVSGEAMGGAKDIASRRSERTSTKGEWPLSLDESAHELVELLRACNKLIVSEQS